MAQVGMRQLSSGVVTYTDSQWTCSVRSDLTACHVERWHGQHDLQNRPEGRVNST